MEELKERFIEIYDSNIVRPGKGKLLDYLKKSDFFEAPASSKYHGSYPGGLLEHTLNVYDALTDLTIPYGEAFYEVSSESIAICALLHDVCKVNYYEKTETGYKVKDPFPYGHGEKSVLFISQFMDLKREEQMAINWHMGAYDDRAAAGFRLLGDAMKYSPLVPALHLADMIATHIIEREKP